MKTEKEAGGYSRQIVRLHGSFQINGTTTPDVIRDGKSKLIKSVSRDAAGKFTVTFNDHGVLPALLTSERATISTTNSPTKVCEARVVVGSYSQSSRSFQIVCIKTGTVGGSAAAPVVDDPDDNDRVNFELVGSLTSAGKDAA